MPTYLKALIKTSFSAADAAITSAGTTQAEWGYKPSGGGGGETGVIALRPDTPDVYALKLRIPPLAGAFRSEFVFHSNAFNAISQIVDGRHFQCVNNTANPCLWGVGLEYYIPSGSQSAFFRLPSNSTIMQFHPWDPIQPSPTLTYNAGTLATINRYTINGNTGGKVTTVSQLETGVAIQIIWIMKLTTPNNALNRVHYRQAFAGWPANPAVNHTGGNVNDDDPSGPYLKFGLYCPQKRLTGPYGSSTAEAVIYFSRIEIYASADATAAEFYAYMRDTVMAGVGGGGPTPVLYEIRDNATNAVVAGQVYTTDPTFKVVRASDGFTTGMSSVTFSGAAAGVDSSAPFTCTPDVSVLGNGQHTVFGQVADSAADGAVTGQFEVQLPATPVDNAHSRILWHEIAFATTATSSITQVNLVGGVDTTASLVNVGMMQNVGAYATTSNPWLQGLGIDTGRTILRAKAEYSFASANDNAVLILNTDIDTLGSFDASQGAKPSNGIAVRIRRNSGILIASIIEDEESDVPTWTLAGVLPESQPGFAFNTTYNINVEVEPDFSSMAATVRVHIDEFTSWSLFAVDVLVPSSDTGRPYTGVWWASLGQSGNARLKGLDIFTTARRGDAIPPTFDGALDVTRSGASVTLTWPVGEDLG